MDEFRISDIVRYGAGFSPSRAEFETDVNTLVETLELPGPRVSQHLSLMRAHRIVEERRDGRHHYYHLTQPEIANWIIEGLNFVEGRMTGVSKSAIKSARQLWSVNNA